jgi:hypothetical protein
LGEKVEVPEKPLICLNTRDDFTAARFFVEQIEEVKSGIEIRIGFTFE